MRLIICGNPHFYLGQKYKGVDRTGLCINENKATANDFEMFADYNNEVYITGYTENVELVMKILNRIKISFYTEGETDVIDIWCEGDSSEQHFGGAEFLGFDCAIVGNGPSLLNFSDYSDDRQINESSELEVMMEHFLKRWRHKRNKNILFESFDDAKNFLSSMQELAQKYPEVTDIEASSYNVIGVYRVNDLFAV